MEQWKRTVAVWVMTAILFCGIPRPLAAWGQETPGELHAGFAVLIDGDTGRVLYGKNEKEIRPMASTTKIMTCILALELGNLDDEVTFSSKAVSQPEVHLGAQKGEAFSLRDLLYSLMLESHNDTAVAVAEAVGGSVEMFCHMMNEKAREIGCENTCFLTPNGLDQTVTDENGTTLLHSTTASDLGRMMAYCVWQSSERTAFLKITRTQNYSFSNKSGSRTYSCYNHNAYLEQDPEAVSGKTGFTGEAGYCYVAAVESKGRHLAAAVLGCGWPPHKTYKWSDIRRLFAYGREHFHKERLRQDICLPEIPVTGGIAASKDPSEKVSVALKTGENMKKPEILLADGEKIRVEQTIEKVLSAPVKKGQKVGEITYYVGDWAAEKIPVVAASDVPSYTWSWCLEWMINIFFNKKIVN